MRDAVATDGKVHDPQRIDFTRRYLRSLHRAISEGVKVNGYFHWSVMDNFEWAEGYKERFGLIHVDYATQERTLKDSAYWYRDVIASERTSGDFLAAHPRHACGVPTPPRRPARPSVVGRGSPHPSLRFAASRAYPRRVGSWFGTRVRRGSVLQRCSRSVAPQPLPALAVH